MKARLAIVQRLANVAGLGLLWWGAAPLIPWNGQHPFEDVPSRLLGLAILGLLVGAAWALHRFWRARRNARLFDQLQGDAAASEALSERFRAAMQLLKAGIAIEGPRSQGPRTGGWSARLGRWLRGRRQVYELPWYLIIGAPGAGKTTALLHSGLRFPLAERLGAAPVAGIGGTRQCDWWFTDRAVFIDTAGRYTTQDSHAASDAQEWNLFLRLLRRHRPVQPVNGVIVTVSVPDLLQGGSELEHQAVAVDRRLQELRSELGLSFPVYLLVTKADLLAGFVEFFGDFDAAQREQTWGLTFEHPVPPGAGALPSNLSTRLLGLTSRLASLGVQRVQDEPQLQRRAAIHRFSAQVEATLPALEGFARRAFAQAGAAPMQFVRGIHFSSGTQEGNPIDRVLGELSRSFGMALRTLPRPDAGGKAYFLAELLQRLVIAEAPLAGNNLARQRQRRRMALGAAAVLGSALVAASVAWGLSLRSNLEYVDAVRQRVDQLVRQSANLPAGRIDTLLPLYELLGQLAGSSGVDPMQPPPGFDFGLFQGPRLAQAADQTYHRVLDQTLAPLLAQRLSQALRQEGDAPARYEALRISLMLSAPERLDRAEVRRWAAQAIAAPTADAPPIAATAGPSASGVALSPATAFAPGRGEQQEWLRHLDALLERNAVLQVVRLDEGLVRAARAAVTSVPFAQRVHERLLGRARETLAGAHSLADVAGPGALVVFAPGDSILPVPMLPAVNTRQAWRERIEPTLDATIQELADESAWVLGDQSPALARLARERDARVEVARAVAQRHAQATLVAWERMLAAVVLPPVSDGSSLQRLAGALAAPDSALRALLKRLAGEFPAAAGSAAAGAPLSAATAAYDAVLIARFGALADYARGPGDAALARVLDPLPLAAREPASARAAEVAREVRAEASRAPTPLRDVWTVLADGLSAQQRKLLDKQLAGSLAALTQGCQRLVEERFPFVPGARRDMPLADFAQLFGPQGLLDDFFRTHLAAQVDTSSRPWRLTGGVPPQGKAQASLRAFEMAADIRRLFFSAGSPLPQLRLQLTPVRMDDELLQFSIDIDGQVLRYENGPRRTKPVVWPGPAATHRVLMRIFPTSPSGVDAEVRDGPWALLRVLQPAADAGARGAAGPRLMQLAVDGRRLQLEATTDGPAPAGLLSELGSFRCPEGW